MRCFATSVDMLSGTATTLYQAQLLLQSLISDLDCSFNLLAAINGFKAVPPPVSIMLVSVNRGNSKYHYYGIRIKPDSPLNTFPTDDAVAMRQPSQTAQR